MRISRVVESEDIHGHSLFFCLSRLTESEKRIAKQEMEKKMNELLRRFKE